MLPNHLRHVAVLILDPAQDRTLPILTVEVPGNAQHSLFFLLQLFGIMIPENIIGRCLGDAAPGAGQMVESLPALCFLRNLIGGKHGIGFHNHLHGVDHLPFCRAGMYRNAVCSHAGCRRVESLIFQFVGHRSVHSVGKLSSEFFQIQKSRAVADLFIRSKADTYLSVRDFICNQTLTHSQDFGNPGFIVRSQDRSPVSRNNRFANAVLQMRKNFRVQHTSRISQCNSSSVIVFYNDRMGIRTTAVVNSIQMSYKANCPAFFITGRSRQKTVGIGMFVYLYTGKSQYLHLLCQKPGQLEFSLASRRTFRLLVTGRVDNYVF